MNFFGFALSFTVVHLIFFPFPFRWVLLLAHSFFLSVAHVFVLAKKLGSNLGCLRVYLISFLQTWIPIPVFKKYRNLLTHLASLPSLVASFRHSFLFFFSVGRGQSRRRGKNGSDTTATDRGSGETSVRITTAADGGGSEAAIRSRENPRRRKATAAAATRERRRMTKC